MLFQTNLFIVVFLKTNERFCILSLLESYGFFSTSCVLIVSLVFSYSGSIKLTLASVSFLVGCPLERNGAQTIAPPHYNTTTYNITHQNNCSPLWLRNVLENDQNFKFLSLEVIAIKYSVHFERWCSQWDAKYYVSVIHR